MNTPTELLRQALDVLENVSYTRASGWEKAQSSIEAIRTHLDSGDVQEPVAWQVRGHAQFRAGSPGAWRYVCGGKKPQVNHPEDCNIEPLYATPKQEPVVSQWLPIETAPESIAIDLWCKSTSNPAYGRRVTQVCLVGDNWYGGNLPNPAFGEYASHWMPLPAAPT